MLIDVPEGWDVDTVTPEMVRRANDKRLTSPGGFTWVCTFLGSPVGTPAPIFIFAAPPRIAQDLTAEELLGRFVKVYWNGGDVDMRGLTLKAGRGVEGTFVTPRGVLEPIQRRAFVLSTANGTVAITQGGIDQKMTDQGSPAYESVRDSTRPPE